MGWISGNQKVSQPSRQDTTGSSSTKHGGEEQTKVPGAEETLASNRPSQTRPASGEYPFQPSDVLDCDLPFISALVVTSKRRPRLTAPKADKLENFPHRQDWWIVVDGIVYDCTDFVLDHPGGAQVIASFVGEDCSWQFWRFHSKTIMEQYGRELRIGRTDERDIVKRFEEKNRWTTFRGFRTDEW